MRLQGTYTALITPFQGHEVDYDGLRQNVAFQIDNGITGLVALGTTAETPVLSEAERERILATVLETANGRVPVIAGTGSNATEHTISDTRRAREAGADAALIVAPYYNKPTQEGIYRHFAAIADAVDIPIIVYNIIGRTGVNITTDTMERLARIPSIIAVKEASGSIAQAQDVIQRIVPTRDDFSVLSGDDGLAPAMISMGGHGVISVASNLIPRETCELINATLNGDLARMRRIFLSLNPVFQALFIETNPVPVKEAMAYWGMPSGVPRLPLVPLTDNNRATLFRVLDTFRVAGRIEEAI